ncbi:MAG: aspartate--tRNA ligase [Candidatus Wildermuthbacteria bacterium]|nr:aspartate--tRNA ligase [Candidatus Wildermuthbacteria bacterium]
MKRMFTDEVIGRQGETVELAGWVANRRDHGKLVFIDLRDWRGTVQVVFTPQNKEAYAAAQELRPEWVVALKGTVQTRPAAMVNDRVATGGVEIAAQELAVLSKAKTVPFPIDTAGYELSEEKRLQYRYLDLRRPRMKRNLVMRSRVIHFMREFLLGRGFVEIETPMLTKSTPEGARDFVVPSRLHPGKFYALPQSPQQYKQLLQVAGFERYFQIVRCFRDEDPRADRHPEFTQLDIEMSFVEREDILSLIEELYISLVKELFPEKHIQQTPFPRLSYQEVMETYQSDKPDIRTNKEDANELAFAFVVDFPTFEWKESEKRWDAVHHPFTRPQTDDIEALKKNPGTIPSYQYDFVLNGYEIGGGSLRITNPTLQEAVFEIMGHSKEHIKEQFGHLLEAFEYGVPPHGGIAPGVDRFLEVVLGEPSIREVIAFPKTGDNRDPMMDGPSALLQEQAKELHIHIDQPKKSG